MRKRREVIKSDNSYFDDLKKIRDKFVYQSQNGKKTILSKMDKNHIKNCLNKMERLANQVGRGGHDAVRKNKKIAPVFKKELLYREILEIEKNN